ncbi:AfsR/SARP family transcriptional regulator [Amycolatopsis sp. H20-H5]|uniref:AfsR/SARP family transcriptional regulator n=1 Tax=Amycolatopsis sp. H20-H5 TaxID=3046309 RepID=UPI002DBE93E0|nr:BTAD domain-containing putative transcriptional regulator [Amycolatopsis sp. H20-H5]MEC3976590.1 BTAD domain-containing putative transcriptional regulator [Amycolatopsis sp. H20-H5]
MLDGERSCAPTAAKPRALLALLLAHGGQVVPVHRLIMDLWDGEPPPTANTALQVYVHQTRRLLMPGRGGRDAAQPLKLVAAGYRLDLTGHTCDVVEFDQLAKAGMDQLHHGDAESASATLRRALELWRGPAFADVDVQSVKQDHAGAMERLRATALLGRIDADLQLDRYADLVPELTKLVASNPLNERLAERLMTALAGSGRQVDALELYRDVRRQVRSQSGTEPSAGLRRLQHAILSQDFGRSAPVAPTSRIEAGQLPLDTPGFTGREAALDQLRDLLTADPSGSRVCLVGGLAGVGKTALAVHAAHELAPQFPDGRLYADLRGFDDCPADPADVLATWLEALGRGRRSLAEDLEGRSRQFRTAIAGRRLLFVIDNAACEAQVRPLLPSAAGCATVVTSRRPLVGLEGVDRVQLDVPGPAEALRMFTEILGAGRTGAEPGAAASIVAACGRLPLAVRIAATRLAASPDRSLGEFADQLAASFDMLSELSAGELQVRAAFAASYQACSERERRAFRRLSQVSAPHFPSWVVAAAVDVDQRDGEQLVESLVEMHLLRVIRRDEAGQLRYGFHDLVKVYAEEKLYLEEPAADRRAVIRRIVEGYNTLVGRAEAVVSPARRPHRLTGRPEWDPAEHGLPAFDERDLVSWLETEAECLVAAIQDAGRAGLPEVVLQLADRLVWFFELRGDWDRWGRVLTQAEQAAERLGDGRSTAITRQMAGRLAWNRNQVRETLRNLHHARRIWAALDEQEPLAQISLKLAIVHLHWGSACRTAALLDRCTPTFLVRSDLASQAAVCYVRGALEYDRGEYASAAESFERSAHLFGIVGDRRTRAEMLVKLAKARQRGGEFQAAEGQYKEGLEVFRYFRDRRLESWALSQLAQIHRLDGRLDEATAELAEAKVLCQQIGDPRLAAHILSGLGELSRDRGYPEEAADWLRQALRKAELAADPRGAARIRCVLAEIQRTAGDFEDAAAGFRGAVAAFGDLGLLRWQARALEGLGHVLSDQGLRCQAVPVWRNALVILRQLSAPDAGELAALIAGPPRPTSDVA